MKPGAVPVPERARVCGLPVALSVMLRIADSLPAVAGLKVTDKFAFAPGATVTGNVGIDDRKSALLAPVIETAEITKLAVPVFVSVTAAGLLLDPCA